MKEQFEDLAGSDGKVTMGAVIDFINGVKDDGLSDAQVEDLVKGVPLPFLSLPFLISN